VARRHDGEVRSHGEGERQGAHGGTRENGWVVVHGWRAATWARAAGCRWEEIRMVIWLGFLG